MNTNVSIMSDIAIRYYLVIRYIIIIIIIIITTTMNLYAIKIII